MRLIYGWIQMEIPFSQNVQVELWNIIGALVHTQKVVNPTGTTTVSVENFTSPSGLYFYKIKSKGAILKSGKLM